MMHTNERSRRGSLTIVVLVCLIVCVGLLSGNVRSLLLSRRHALTQHDVRQCEWLLKAGVRRAERATQEDENYDGETWNLMVPPVGFDAAIVRIEVNAMDADTNRVRVMAELKHDDASVIRRSHELVASIPPSDSESSDESD